MFYRSAEVIMSLSELPQPPACELRIWVVIQKHCTGLSLSSMIILDTITLVKTDSGPVVVGNVKAKYLKRHRFYQTPDIEVAIIPPVSTLTDLKRNRSTKNGDSLVSEEISRHCPCRMRLLSRAR
jgi:hypothetical protein